MIINDIYSFGVSVFFFLFWGVDSNISFVYDFNFNGSIDLYFMFFGKIIMVQLFFIWMALSFEGVFLLDEWVVSDSGFIVDWQVLQFNCNYLQQGVGCFVQSNDQDFIYYGIDLVWCMASIFGLKLFLFIDEYQKMMWLAKYVIYFILLIFLIFFFIEIFNCKWLYFIQYLLVGVGIVLFYILLLFFFEYLSFDMVYWIVCVAILLLIIVYSYFMLCNCKLIVMVFGILAILYGFFYFILQLQDYVLLMGSLGLLFILAVIMYLMWNVDWYGLKWEE